MLPALIDHTSTRKNSNDIQKLYVNMISIMKDNGTNKMFCMRYYGNNMPCLILINLNQHPPLDHHIYFEKLVKYDDITYRIIDARIEVSNTPQKILPYINQIPSMFAWKDVIIDHILGVWMCPICAK